jgi:hypothetical protein
VSMTDDHTWFSEFGGDANADDDLPTPATTSKDTSQPGCSSKQPTEEDFNSDDNVADLDYIDPTYTHIRISIIYLQIQVRTRT